MTCKQCDHAKTLPQIKKANESPTSPLLLLGQESQNAVTVGKGAKRKSFNQPVPPPVPAVGLLASSLEMKSATPDSSSAQKNQRKLCSWGLIWKKNKSEDGTKFRLEDIILRGNKHMTWSGPVCHLCNKPYNSDLTYIRCETCKSKPALPDIFHLSLSLSAWTGFLLSFGHSCLLFVIICRLVSC